jgi:protein gp37
LRTRKPGRIFVCSTSDLFHPEVRIEDLEKVWRTIWTAQRGDKGHTFLILTKRPDVMKERLAIVLRRVFGDDEFHFAGQRVWLGVTAENQRRYDERWAILKTIPAAVRFVSVEPMLERIWLWEKSEAKPDWVIAGLETGPKARRCLDVWIDDLSYQSRCFFDKRETWTRREWPQGRKV